MSKLGDALRARGFVNSHDLLKRFGVKGRDVMVSYHPWEPRGHAQTTMVYSPSHKTDPSSPWYNHGNKAFVGNRAASMPKAIAWATEKYGVKEWVPSPLDVSGKIPKYVRDAAAAFVKDKA